jgi:hypothetical protein
MYDNHHLLDIDTLMVADELENVFYFCQRTALGLNSPANLTLDIHVDRIRLRPGPEIALSGFSTETSTRVSRRSI